MLKVLSRRPRIHGYSIMAAIANTSGEVLRYLNNAGMNLVEAAGCSRVPHYVVSKQHGLSPDIRTQSIAY
jgi:hypothetical protein